MNETPTTNERGEYTNCAFHAVTGKNNAKCNALKDWYNIIGKRHCDRCPFFKTVERLANEAKKIRVQKG